MRSYSLCRHRKGQFPAEAELAFAHARSIDHPCLLWQQLWDSWTWVALGLTAKISTIPLQALTSAEQAILESVQKITEGIAHRNHAMVIAADIFVRTHRRRYFLQCQMITAWTASR